MTCIGGTGVEPLGPAGGSHQLEHLVPRLLSGLRRAGFGGEDFVMAGGAQAALQRQLGRSMLVEDQPGSGAELPGPHSQPRAGGIEIDLVEPALSR